MCACVCVNKVRGFVAVTGLAGVGKSVKKKKKKKLWLQVSLGGILGQGCVTVIRENWKGETDRKEQ